MRGSTAEIAALELDGGKIKDVSALETLVNGDFSGLVSTTQVKGADVDKAAFDSMPLSDQMRYANEHPREAAEWLRKE